MKSTRFTMDRLEDRITPSYCVPTCSSGSSHKGGSKKGGSKKGGSKKGGSKKNGGSKKGGSKKACKPAPAPKKCK